MRSGELNQLIKLQSPTIEKVEGEIQTTWADVADVWAKVISQKGSDAFETARLNAKETIRLQMHYRTDVNAKWRIIWQERIYSIVAPPDRSQHRHGEMWVTAQAVDIV